MKKRLIPLLLTFTLLLPQLFPLVAFAQGAAFAGEEATAPEDTVLDEEETGGSSTADVAPPVEDTPAFFTVTLEPMGGAAEFDAVQTGEDGSLAQIPTASRDGHTLLGWTLEEVILPEGFTDEAIASLVFVTEATVFTEDATIYAVWMPPAPIAPAAYTGAETFASYFAPFSNYFSATNSAGTTAWVLHGLDGATVLKSGMEGKRSSSGTITLDCVGAGQLSFDYKVSSEANYDYFSITKNGTALSNGKTLSGEIDWTTFSVNVQPGDTLVLSYTKDASGDKGSDCVYLRGFYVGSPSTVTFHANNGSGETSTQEIFGKGTLAPNAFSKEGAVFAGWATSAQGALAYRDEEQVDLASDLELFALWSAAFTVTFAYGDGTTPASTICVAQNSPLRDTQIPKPVRTGYTFLGWFDGEDELTAATPITADVTYTATWQANHYTVRLTANGGIGDTVELAATYDENLALPKSPFAREGYTFKEWGTSSSGGTRYPDGSAVKNLSSTQNAVVTLYALWAGNPVPVNFDLNYETKNKVTTRTSVFGSSYQYVYNETTGSSYSAVATPARNGFIFDGWFTEKMGGNAVSLNTSISTTQGHTLYAQWSEAVLAHFDGGLYTTAIADKTVKKDAVFASLPTINTWSYPTGYNLVGWFTEPTGGEQVSASTVFAEEEITLYARWEANTYTVSFNANGGVGSMESVTVAYGEEFDLPINSFTREGYTFKGWSTGAWSTTVAHPDGKTVKNLSTTNNGTISLYAVWEQTTFGLALANINQAITPYETVSRIPVTIPLPVSGANYTVAWASSDADFISPTGEVLQLPDTGSKEVVLTASVTELSTSGTETFAFAFTLQSEKMAAAETYLLGVKAALDNAWYTPRPTFGTDSNAVALLEEKLVSINSSYSDVDVQIKEAVASGYAGIAEDGTISYYYRDPNTTAATNFSTLPTVYLLAKDGASVEWAKNTIVHWDQDKVEEAMREEILPGVTEAVILDGNVKDFVVDDLVLPKYVDGKKWCEVSWTSSDTGTIWVSDEKQTTANTLAEPYVGKIIRGAEDKTVVLTAKFSFTFTNASYEKEIVLYKVFTVLVPALSTEELDEIQKGLLAKIDAGVESAGFRDYLTKERFAQEGETYIAANDIQYPSTRDFGVDGKYYPVTITSTNGDVIQGTDVANAARSFVYRPLPGNSAEEVEITIAIRDTAKGVSAARTYQFRVEPLTGEELAAASALMATVQDTYFEGLNGANYQDYYSVSGKLSPFQEAIWGAGEAGNPIQWIYTHAEKTNGGIIADEIDGWEEQEAWRAFRSSDPTVLDHETLNFTQPQEDTFVRVSSSLTHAVYGKYWVKYQGNSEYALFRDLYRQPVCEYVMVEGANHIERTPQELAALREQAITDISAPITATMLLADFAAAPGAAQATARSASVARPMEASGHLLSATISNLEAGTTVFGLFRRVMAENNYTYSAVGSYIRSITDAGGNTLAERDGGPNSGWIYTVNGTMPLVYMNGYTLKQGDVVEIKYTADYTAEPGGVLPEEPSPPAPVKPGTPAGPDGTNTTKTPGDPNTNTDEGNGNNGPAGLSREGSGLAGDATTSSASSAVDGGGAANAAGSGSTDQEGRQPDDSANFDDTYIAAASAQTKDAQNPVVAILLVAGAALFLVGSGVVYARFSKRKKQD